MPSFGKPILHNCYYMIIKDILQPSAYKKNSITEKHGEVRNDYYAWLEKRNSPDVLKYLHSENRYTNEQLKNFKPEIKEIHKELLSLCIFEDESLPSKKRDYVYYKKTVLPDGSELYCRKKVAQNSHEEVLLDTRQLIKKKGEFCMVNGVVVSPDNSVMAYGVDYVGRRLYKLRFKNLITGEDYPESINNTEGGNYAWSSDNRTCYYIVKNQLNLLGEKVRKHIIGNDPAKDETVYREFDNRFYLKLNLMGSGKYILITSYKLGIMSECHYLDASKPEQNFKVFEKRSDNVLYYLMHKNDTFYIRTNFNAPWFRIMQVSDQSPSLSNATELIPQTKGIFKEFFALTKDYIVIKERKDNNIFVSHYHEKTKEIKSLNFPDPSFSVRLSKYQNLEANSLVYQYSTLDLPERTFSLDLDTNIETVLYEKKLKNYQRSNYVTKAFNCVAHDESDIPVTMIYDKRCGEPANSPMLILAYGAYGANYEPSFKEIYLPLINRGFCFVIAHIRGGSYLGQSWYEEGRHLNKKNTFYDFISVAEQMIKDGYTSSDKLFAMGRSAGGLLMGAVLNMRPNLFKGVIAEVPFVDPLNTSLNDDLPLVTNEYQEWGDPRVREDYFYIKSYSPYENIQEVNYPHIFVETGFEDSQVMYFEPAKWVAKLREYRSDKNLLLFRIHMKAGHTGPSNYVKYLKDKAEKLGLIYGIYKHGL